MVLNLLIVEDEAAIREGVREYLSEQGFHVFTAEDCGGAIKGNRIDIYVNDHDRANALGVNHADVYLVK